MRKKLAGICSSEIACKVYAKGVTSTVHEYYGLGIGDLPSKQLIQRAASNSLVVERIQDADVILWDEVSISSSRIFFNFNLFQEMCTSSRFA